MISSLASKKNKNSLAPLRISRFMRQDNTTRTRTTNRWKNSLRVGWATSNQNWWNQNPVSEDIKGWVLDKIAKSLRMSGSADDRRLQVSSLHYKAALLLDEVDRVNFELSYGDWVEFVSFFMHRANIWKKSSKLLIAVLHSPLTHSSRETKWGPVRACSLCWLIYLEVRS